MKTLIRVVVILLFVTVASNLASHPPQVMAESASGNDTSTVYLPFSLRQIVTSDAQSFDASQSGMVDSGGGHILSVSPGSIPTYQNGALADMTLSVEPNVSTVTPPPSWLRLVSQPANFGPERFIFDFPLTVRMPVQGVKDVAQLFFVRLGQDGSWTRSFFSFDPAKLTEAVESTLFTLGTMAVGEYDGVIPAALHAQGGLRVEKTTCPIGGRQCFYYLTIQSFVPKYPDEAPAGSFVGNTLRLRSNVTGESPLPTGWLLPQGTYTFCYSALESPLTLSYLDKFINTNLHVVTIDKPYHCSSTSTCFTRVEPLDRDGWTKAQENRLCGMGGTLTSSDPATLGNTGDFQTTLSWNNTSSSATDLDLHLYGPNNLHVWYTDKFSIDGSLRLDEDWQTGTGNAVENIYQLKDGSGKSKPMPTGTYTIRVKHFAGANNKPYQVRVILNGSVRNFNGTLSSGQEHTLMTFTVQ